MPQGPPPARRRARLVPPGPPGTGPPGRNAGSQLSICPRVRRPFSGVRVLSCRGHPAETRAASCPFAPESAAHSTACASCPAGAARHRTTRPKRGQPAVHLPQSPPPIQRRARLVPPGPPGRNAGSQLSICPRVRRLFGGVRVLSRRGHPATGPPGRNAGSQLSICPRVRRLFSGVRVLSCRGHPAWGQLKPKIFWLRR